MESKKDNPWGGGGGHPTRGINKVYMFETYA